jgi:phospholipid N-methyltransferase
LVYPIPEGARVVTSNLTFLRQFVAAPRHVGAIWPSSPSLARSMLSPVAFATADTIVELGPGTGAVTTEIAKHLTPNTRYLGIELNPAFYRGLKHDFPHLDFANSDVAEFDALLSHRGLRQIDAVISGLPWASLPVSLQSAVLPSVARHLSPGGVFVTFAYIHGLALPAAQALHVTLRRHFPLVRRSKPVWLNVPPAICYICGK